MDKYCEECKVVKLGNYNKTWPQCEVCMVILCGNCLENGTCIDESRKHILLKDDVYSDLCKACSIRCWPTHVHCPNCGASPEFQEVRNYSMMWHDGDIHCTRCDAYVRGYDAG